MPACVWFVVALGILGILRSIMVWSKGLGRDLDVSDSIGPYSESERAANEAEGADWEARRLLRKAMTLEKKGKHREALDILIPLRDSVPPGERRDWLDQEIAKLHDVRDHRTKAQDD